MLSLPINGKGRGCVGTSFQNFTGYVVARIGESPRQYDLVEGAGLWGGYWAAMECTRQPNREVAVFETRKEAEEHVELSQLEGL